MKSTSVGIRYAKALLQLASEQNILPQVSNDMKLVYQTIRQSHEFSVFLNSPIIKPDKKQAVLTHIFADKVSELTIKFFQLLVSRKRERYIEVIADQFVNLYNKHLGVQLVQVTSAVALDDSLRAKVLQLVKKVSKSEVELIEQVNPKIIGGFIIRMDDKQLDRSVSSELLNFKKYLLQNKN
jgi:F-type H+-transporting ATPase subunit delta